METKTLIPIGDRSGYEYRYSIRTDDAMLSSYARELSSPPATYWKNFLIEVRTDFILQSIDNNETILDSERYASIVPAHAPEYDPEYDPEYEMYLGLRYRMLEYWVPDFEILRLSHEAFCFAKRLDKDPRTASARAIPIVVGLDVCTVQMEGESREDSIERSIAPNCLIPLSVWGIGIVLADKSSPRLDLELRMHLVDLPEERVDDWVGKGSSLMASCPICSRPPTFGSQLTSLPCDHVFHRHCVVRWLIHNTTCPQCHSQVPIKRWD